MEKQFVTYEIAKEISKLGFNEPCFDYYLEKNQKFSIKIGITNSKIEKERLKHPYKHEYPNKFAAPLWQQAIDWLREKYDINIEVSTIEIVLLGFYEGRKLNILKEINKISL